MNENIENTTSKNALYFRLLPLVVTALRDMIEKAVEDAGWVRENDPDSFQWIDAEGWSGIDWNQLFFFYKKRYYSINVSMFDGDPIQPNEIFSTQEEFCHDFIITPCSVMVFLGGVNNELRNLNSDDQEEYKFLLRIGNVIITTNNEPFDFNLNFDKPLQCVSEIFVTDKITLATDQLLTDDDMTGDDAVSRNIMHRDTLTRYLKFAIPVPVLREIRCVYDMGRGVDFDKPLTDWEEIAYKAERLNVPEAWHNLALRLFYEGKLIPTFFEYIKRAHDGGCKEADLMLDTLAIYGMTESMSPQEGFGNLQKLVKDNPQMSNACAYLGNCYWNGQCTDKDINKALELFHNSENDPLSCLCLSMIYGFDDQFKDLDKSYSYLHKCIDLGYDNFLINLRHYIRQYEPLLWEFDSNECNMLILFELFISLGDEWSKKVRDNYLETVEKIENNDKH